MTTPLRDYTKIEKKNCQLVTHYGRKKFKWPFAIAIGPNDEVVIVDNNKKEVIILDKDLKLVRSFGQGNRHYELSNPVDVAVGHNVIAVSELSHHVVKKFSLQGDCLSKFGSRGSDDGQFNYPQGLCFNSKGLLYVVDRSNHRVQVFEENNIFQFKFGSKGCDPGQFKEPRYIAVDSSDQVYVTDFSDDGGISVFREDGHFINRIPCNTPFAICIAPDDYTITEVNKNDVLTVLSPTHKYTAKFGVHGKDK